MPHQAHLTAAYPHLADMLGAVAPLPMLCQQALPVPQAVTKVVVGQMLSRSAAACIYNRLVTAHREQGLAGSWQLSEADLLSAGLSRRKVRTIGAFRTAYESDPASVDAWPDLSHDELGAAVKQHWGLSQWSTDILAIFYFANPDVFPATDGTIKRALQRLDEVFPHIPLDPSLARPYRSYLALSLWAALDTGILDSRRSQGQGL